MYTIRRNYRFHGKIKHYIYEFDHYESYNMPYVKTKGQIVRKEKLVRSVFKLSKVWDEIIDASQVLPQGRRPKEIKK